MNLLAKILPTQNDDFFESKEHYLAFRAAWSKAMNSEEKHNLTCDHHLLYIAARKRDFLAGFSPIMRESKLRGEEGAAGERYRTAVKSLRRVTITRRGAQKLLEGNESYARGVNNLLAPFDGTITPEMLIQIDDYIQKNYEVLATMMGQRIGELYASGIERFYRQSKNW